MCGIVGYLGSQNAETILVEGLARLEYRGYDSAGVATAHNGTLHVRRAAGKLSALKGRLQQEPCPGVIGIGHTRWATHGKPNEQNAHPQTSDGVVVVHNGIIENHRELRAQLVAQGRVFQSETDTEIFAHLIALARAAGRSLLDAVRDATQRVEGAYAIAVLDVKDPTRLCFAKQQSPLVIGVGSSEMFIASDVPALLAHTREFVFLEDGDVGEVTAAGANIVRAQDGQAVQRARKTIQWSAAMAEKDGHKHFMHKEIFEQPRAVTDTLRGRMQLDDNRVVLDGVSDAVLKSIDRVLITACGTSFHAGMVARTLIEQLARVPCDIELASELRYRDPVLSPRTLLVAISQSGETADTLAAVQEAIRRGAQTLAVCNVVDSAIARACEKSAGVLYTRAGPEIGVASTKAFTTQLVALHLLALGLAQAKASQTPEQVGEHLQALMALPRQIEAALTHESSVRDLAQLHVQAKDMLYLGRGTAYPIALEGALKLKEISYIHAEGYAAGEMKHGPIALIDEHMPVVVLALRGPGYDKVVSNLETVRARGGRVLAVAVDDDADIAAHTEAVMRIPNAHPATIATVAVVPLQLFAYHVADLRGTDVDQPRNLAKSVTVE